MALSVKTNPLPYLLRRARQMGYYAEAASASEWQLALDCGFDKRHIVYNGPLKSRDTFLDAVASGALVNIDTFRELQWLDLLPHSGRYAVGLRLNVNLSQLSPSDQSHPGDDSRFGFCDTDGDLDAALAALAAMPHVSLERLHLHRASRTRHPRVYERLVDHALTLMRRHGIALRQLDVGGGFQAMLPAQPTHSQYAQAIARALARHQLPEPPTVIVEPGLAVVAQAFSFVCSVIDVKHHDGAAYVTTDGSRIDLDPMWRMNHLTCRVRPAHRDAPIVERQIVCGCTCVEHDRLLELRQQPALQPDDQLVFRHMGAYTLTLTPAFMRPRPTVYVSHNGQLTPVS